MAHSALTRILPAAALLLVAVLFAGLPGPADVRAQSNLLVVTNNNASGPGSLNDALDSANPGAEIVFSGGLPGPIVAPTPP